MSLHFNGFRSSFLKKNKRVIFSHEIKTTKKQEALGENKKRGKLRAILKGVSLF